jgi:uncharacterized protein (DUF697 family)
MEKIAGFISIGVILIICIEAWSWGYGEIIQRTFKKGADAGTDTVDDENKFTIADPPGDNAKDIDPLHPFFY